MSENEKRYALWKVQHTRSHGTIKGWWRQDGKVVLFDSYEAALRKADQLNTASLSQRHHMTFLVGSPDEYAAPPITERERLLGEGWSVDDDDADWVAEERRLAADDAFFGEWDRRRRNEREGPHDD